MIEVRLVCLLKLAVQDSQGGSAEKTKAGSETKPWSSQRTCRHHKMGKSYMPSWLQNLSTRTMRSTKFWYVAKKISHKPSTCLVPIPKSGLAISTFPDISKS